MACQKDRFVRRYLTVLFCILVLAGAAIFYGRATPVVRADNDDDFLPGEIVVELVSPTYLAAVAAEFSLDPTPLGQFGSRPIFRLRITDGAPVKNRVDALCRDTRVVYAEPN